jgi:predicted aldo/keto reductase-like oxidoreductase
LKYRLFGKLNWKASALGFGAMRLPIVGNDAANVNEPEAIRMIRYAVDKGVNYVDTAYVYHRGKSEEVVGKALRDGYREKVRLATKMPTWMVSSQGDMDKFFNEQLIKLQTDYLDFYLLHGLNQDSWNKLKQLGVLDWLMKKVENGKIGHLGFSFHDEYNAFKNIVDDYDGWTFCQIQYNYVDADFQAGTRGLTYAASKGLAVVIMEPIAGGKLAIPPPKPIQDIWDTAQVKRTQAEWALRWVWNHPEVSVVLSGMSNMGQVKQNVQSAGRSKPSVMTEKELWIVDQVRQKYKELGFVQCTGCRYCMPCPEGVNIPKIMSLYNEYYVRGKDEEIKNKYWEHITPESQAKRCARCGRCEELCPQKMPIRDVLAEAAFIFETKF